MAVAHISPLKLFSMKRSPRRGFIVVISNVFGCLLDVAILLTSGENLLARLLASGLWGNALGRLALFIKRTFIRKIAAIGGAPFFLNIALL